jgi:hypothetical protein
MWTLGRQKAVLNAAAVDVLFSLLRVLTAGHCAMRILGQVLRRVE